MMKQYVQYGCGHSAPLEWLNFDVSPTLRVQKTPIIGKLLKNKLNTTFAPHVRYGNIIKGLPVKDNSCDGVYCSHILDNLALEDFRRAMKNTFKILKADGIFRCVLPDLEFEARTYLKNLDSGDKLASIKFQTETILGFVTRPRGLRQILISNLENNRHLWMWDRLSMVEELRTVGFSDIRPCAFHDSADPMFLLVENDEGRFINSLAFESRK